MSEVNQGREKEGREEGRIVPSGGSRLLTGSMFYKVPGFIK